MTTLNIHCLPYRSSRSNSEPVYFRLTQLCGGGTKTIADGHTTLGEAIGILEAGMSDSAHDLLEVIRQERTRADYDENGNIDPEFEEIVGDLVEVHNMGDYMALIEKISE